MPSPGIESRRRPFIASLMRWRHISAGRSPLLPDDRLILRFRHRANFRILHEHAGAGVPAQNSIVVSVGPKSCGLLVVCHSFTQGMVAVSVPGKPVLAKMCMSLTLPDETGVVGALVSTFDTKQNLFRRFHCGAIAKLIGARKKKRDQSLLMGRRDSQDVQANAFGKTRLVQKPVTFGFLQSFWDTFRRDGFQVELHKHLPSGQTY